MLGAPTVAALLLQLAVRSDALSISQGLEPVQDDDAMGKEGGEKALLVFDLDEDLGSSQAEDELEEHNGSIDSDVITDIVDPTKPHVKLSEKQRQKMHKQLYEAEFTSMLNLTRSRQTGELLGVQLCVDLEYDPPFVCKVKKYGLVNEWNEKQSAEGHPEQQILVGDEVFKVNKIEWHHNSRMFTKRISDQFTQSRRKGGLDFLELLIRRKHNSWHRRSSVQREDRHNFLYVKEWDPEIETIYVGENWPLSETMGWTLHSKTEWDPVVISNITSDGLVGNWSRDNPESKIQEGDELVKVDGYTWMHNTTLFMKQVHKKVREAFRSKKTLKLGVRRPRPKDPVDEVPQEPVVQQERDALHDKANKKAEEAGQGDDGVIGAEEEEGELRKADQPRSAEVAKKTAKTTNTEVAEADKAFVQAFVKAYVQTKMSKA